MVAPPQPSAFSGEEFYTQHSPSILKGYPKGGVVTFLFLFFFFSFALQSFAQVNLIPKPNSIEYQKGIYNYSTQLDRIQSDPEFSVAAKLFSSYHHEFNSGLRIRGTRGSQKASIRITKSNSKKFTYVLTVDDNGFLLEAANLDGALQGVQTIRQLLFLSRNDSNNFIIPVPFLVIKDSPKFSHRGLLLDCSRHFFSVETVKKYIDLLAFYKMNVLHWHLTEDQGWRIEIDKYPKLMEVGAWRTEKDGTRYGGFYTKEEIREVVAFAEERGVTVIPEIEMPGHSQAAIASFPWLSCTGEQVEVVNDWGVFKEIYCAGNDSTFMFLEDVLTEVMELFPSKYIHIGGDEAPKFRWEHCDKCQKRMANLGLKDEHELQSYFIQSIEKFLNANGRQLIGWDEILDGGLSPNATVQSWRGMEHGLQAASEKQNVVVSPTSHCYLDYGLDAINLEKVYLFNPIPEGLDAAFEQFILGAEVNMWTEHVPNDSVLDSKVFPRLIAMAEVLWSGPRLREASAEAGPGGDYYDFYNRLQNHYPVLEKMSVSYGLEAEPISVRTFVLNNLTFVEIVPGLPNLTLSYSTNNRPGILYQEPFLLNETMGLKVRAYKQGKVYGDLFETDLIHHKALGIKPRFQSSSSVYYMGGGKMSLVDGLIGSLNFRDGKWTGYSGSDVEVVLDLKKLRPIREVSVNFYKYPNAWIFPPTLVSIEVSQNGKAWQYMGSVEFPATPNDKEQTIVNATIQVLSLEQNRYVRFKAENIGKLPEWHEAAGSDAWIFVDEIIVR